MSASSSLSRPYIGSCHNRNYIYNKPSSSLLTNDFYFSKRRSAKSLFPNQLTQRNYFSNDRSRETFEERVPINYSSSLLSLDERQFNQEQKAKGFLPSSSSSRFLFPTSLTHNDRSSSSSSSSFLPEQQKSRLSHQSKQFHNYPSNFHNSNHHSPLLTSIRSQSNISPLNNMSSLRSSSTLNSKTHSYDQRISDQGNRYIIQLKTDDYQEHDFIITPRHVENQLIIDAKHTEEDSSGGFIRRELHKIFLIPKHINLNKYTYSYNPKTQELTIEMPYLPGNTTEPSLPPSLQDKSQPLTFSYSDLNLTNGGNLHPTIASNITSEPEGFVLPSSTNDSSLRKTTPFDFDLFHRSAFRPQIIQTSSNENKLLMTLDLSDYLPEDIQISIKDQELIVKAERKIQTDTRKSRSSFFQSTSLPPQTDIERLQSNYIDGKLIIEAPYLNRSTKTSEKNICNDQPYQQRTETVIEFVRRRRF